MTLDQYLEANNRKTDSLRIPFADSDTFKEFSKKHKIDKFTAKAIIGNYLRAKKWELMTFGYIYLQYIGNFNIYKYHPKVEQSFMDVHYRMDFNKEIKGKLKWFPWVVIADDLRSEIKLEHIDSVPFIDIYSPSNEYYWFAIKMRREYEYRRRSLQRRLRERVPNNKQGVERPWHGRQRKVQRDRPGQLGG